MADVTATYSMTYSLRDEILSRINPDGKNVTYTYQSVANRRTTSRWKAEGSSSLLSFHQKAGLGF